jgi:hypothetical protein
MKLYIKQQLTPTYGLVYWPWLKLEVQTARGTEGDVVGREIRWFGKLLWVSGVYE